MEVRFASSVDQNAVFGIIYSHFRKEFPKVTRLPALNLPEPIRRVNKDLLFTPHYKLLSDDDNNTLIQIGPQVFSVIVLNVYPGWKTFLDKISFGLKGLEKSEVVEKVLRFGLRYVNFLDFDVLQHSKLEMKLAGTKVDSKGTEFKTEIVDNGFTNVIRIYNSAVHTRFGNPPSKREGSVVDIDTVIGHEIPDFFMEKDALLEKAHETEKKWFFTSMGEDYLNTLEEVAY